MKRAIVIILLALNAILLVPGAILPMGAMMGIGFMTDIRITNATTRPIQVTPIGVWESGRRASLPIYAMKLLPLWPDNPAADYPVAAGQTRTLSYDMDDVQLTELVVTFADGSTGEMTIGPPRLPGVPTPPLPGTITVSGPLPAVSADVGKALILARTPRPMGLFWSAVYAPWLTFALLLWWHRRQFAVVATPASPGTPNAA